MRVNLRFYSLLLVAMLVLGGCFRQASPDVAPPNEPAATTPLPPTALPTEAGQTPFVTPFTPGTGPDMTTMPTLAGPSPTLPVAAPGETAMPEASAEPTAEGDIGIMASPTPLPDVTNTPPFAAGPTFTPIPGAPPVNLNPNAPATATQAVEDGAQADPLRCTYTVESGDTAFYIATLHNITLIELIEANGLDNADYLTEGQVLQIPGCGEGTGEGDTSAEPPAEEPPSSEPTEAIEGPAPTNTPRPDGAIVHVVESGQNLFRISLQYGVTVQQIVDANGLGSENAILTVGQELIIPVQ